MEHETPSPGNVLRACILGLTFLVVVVFAGHGLGPIAVLLVGGRASEYVFPMAAGWIGLASLVLSLFLPRRQQRAIALATTALLFCSWAGFLWVSERRVATAVTSLPMFAAMIWYLRNAAVLRTRSEV